MDRFLVEELLILAWAASVQRANLYAPNSRKMSGTGTFQSAVLSFLETSLLPTYKSKCSEEAHVENIRSLVAAGTLAGGKLLGPGGYKFGVAQKLLNLTLKYLWCLGQVEEPPHCPVDRIVLSKTSLRGKMNWTDIATAEAYERAIAAIKVVASAEGLSLAHWELKCYSRR